MPNHHSSDRLSALHEKFRAASREDLSDHEKDDFLRELLNALPVNNLLLLELYSRDYFELWCFLMENIKLQNEIPRTFFFKNLTQRINKFQGSIFQADFFTYMLEEDLRLSSQAQKSTEKKNKYLKILLDTLSQYNAFDLCPDHSKEAQKNKETQEALRHFFTTTGYETEYEINATCSFAYTIVRYANEQNAMQFIDFLHNSFQNETDSLEFFLKQNLIHASAMQSNAIVFKKILGIFPDHKLSFFESIDIDNSTALRINAQNLWVEDSNSYILESIINDQDLSLLNKKSLLSYEYTLKAQAMSMIELLIDLLESQQSQSFLQAFSFYVENFASDDMKCDIENYKNCLVELWVLAASLDNREVLQKLQEHSQHINSDVLLYNQMNSEERTPLACAIETTNASSVSFLLSLDKIEQSLFSDESIFNELLHDILKSEEDLSYLENSSPNENKIEIIHLLLNFLDLSVEAHRNYLLSCLENCVIYQNKRKTLFTLLIEKIYYQGAASVTQALSIKFLKSLENCLETPDDKRIEVFKDLMSFLGAPNLEHSPYFFYFFYNVEDISLQALKVLQKIFKTKHIQDLSITKSLQSYHFCLENHKILKRSSTHLTPIVIREILKDFSAQRQVDFLTSLTGDNPELPITIFDSCLFYMSDIKPLLEDLSAAQTLHLITSKNSCPYSSLEFAAQQGRAQNFDDLLRYFLNHKKITLELKILWPLVIKSNCPEKIQLLQEKIPLTEEIFLQSDLETETNDLFLIALLSEAFSSAEKLIELCVSLNKKELLTLDHIYFALKANQTDLADKILNLNNFDINIRSHEFGQTYYYLFINKYFKTLSFLIRKFPVSISFEFRTTHNELIGLNFEEDSTLKKFCDLLLTETISLETESEASLESQNNVLAYENLLSFCLSFKQFKTFSFLLSSLFEAQAQQAEVYLRKLFLTPNLHSRNIQDLLVLTAQYNRALDLTFKVYIQFALEKISHHNSIQEFYEEYFDRLIQIVASGTDRNFLKIILKSFLELDYNAQRSELFRFIYFNLIVEIAKLTQFHLLTYLEAFMKKHKERLTECLGYGPDVSLIALSYLKISHRLFLSKCIIEAKSFLNLAMIQVQDHKNELEFSRFLSFPSNDNHLLLFHRFVENSIIEPTILLSIENDHYALAQVMLDSEYLKDNKHPYQENIISRALESDKISYLSLFHEIHEISDFFKKNIAQSKKNSSPSLIENMFENKNHQGALAYLDLLEVGISTEKDSKLSQENLKILKKRHDSQKKEKEKFLTQQAQSILENCEGQAYVCPISYDSFPFSSSIDSKEPWKSKLAFIKKDKTFILLSLSFFLNLIIKSNSVKTNKNELSCKHPYNPSHYFKFEDLIVVDPRDIELFCLTKASVQDTSKDENTLFLSSSSTETGISCEQRPPKKIKKDPKSS